MVLLKVLFYPPILFLPFIIVTSTLIQALVNVFILHSSFHLEKRHIQKQIEYSWRMILEQLISFHSGTKKIWLFLMIQKLNAFIYLPDIIVRLSSKESRSNSSLSLIFLVFPFLVLATEMIRRTTFFLPLV